MADVITRFKLETTQYDSKLRDAAKGISNVAHQAELAGQGFNNFSQKSVEAARTLGQTASGATNAKDKVRDLVGAYNDAAKAYNKLTQEQQQSDFGKALAQSLTQLKGRITEAKQELYSMGDSTKSTGGIMDQLASKLTVNIDAFKLLNVGVSATKAALDVAKDAFFANEAAVDEWGRTMQSAQGLYEGFLNALNTGDISGYLSRMDEIMRAARAAYDELDKLGTMKTIQAPQISAQQTENERMRMMIQTGRYIAPIDGRKASMQNGQLLTPEQIKRIEMQLQNGLKTVTSLVGNEVKQTGKAIDAYYNSLAKQNGMTMAEFRKGTSNWAEFSKKMAGYDAYKDWDKKARTEFARQGGRGNVNFDASNPYADFKKWGVFRVDKQGENSLNDLVKLIQQRDQQTSQAYSTLSQSYRAINRAEGITVSKIMGRGSSGGRATGGGGGSTTKQEQAQAKLDRAQNDYNQTIELATLELKAGTIKEADYNKKKLAAQESLWKAIGDAREIYDSPQLKDAQDKAAAEIVRFGGEVTANIEAQKRMQESAKRVEQAQKRLADAQKRLAEARESGSATAIYKAQQNVDKEAKATERTEFEESAKNGTITELPNGLKIEVVVDVDDSDAIKKISDIQNLNFDPATLTVVTDDAQALADLQEINGVKLDTKTIKVKTDNETSGLESLKRSIRDELEIEHIKIDETTLHTILKDAVQKNINGMDLQLSGLSDQIAKGIDIPDTQWESILEQYNQLRAQIGEKPIEVNLKTGQLAKDGEAATESWKKASSAINSASGALSSIENPAAKIMGTIGQAIATIALAYAETLAQSKEKRNVWAFIATAAAAMISMATTISSIHSSTGYASGGIVDGRAGGFVGGTAYSGDNVGNVRLSSGELVLNRSQQNNLANALEGGMKQIHIVGQLKGEDIVLMADRYGRRSGLGELAFWK